MKKINTIAAVLCMALLCFAATAMAVEFSFYDSVNEWIVTAYAEPNATSGTYSVYLNILDKIGNNVGSLTPELILLTRGDENVRQNPAANGDYLICAGALSEEISLAYKSVGGLNEIFVMDRHFNDQQQEYVKVHNHIKLTGFDLPDPANISVSGSGAFGSVNVGSSSIKYFTVSNTGEADLTINSVNVTGTSFSLTSNTCGTTVTGGNSCTVGIKFEPASATSYAGTLTILSNDGDTPTSTFALTGTGAAVPIGTIDIGFNAYPAIDAASVVCNGLPYTVKVKVTNSGSLPSGPFAVKIYLSLDKNVSAQDIYLGTWNVSNVNAGETLSYTFSDLVTSGLAIHMSYFFLAHADANNNIPNEISETNNVAYRITSVAR